MSSHLVRSVFVFTLFIIYQVSAQTLQLRKSIIVNTQQCSISLPDKYIVPSSIYIMNLQEKTIISQKWFTFDNKSATIHFKDTFCDNPVFALISYRCLFIPDTLLRYPRIINQKDKSLFVLYAPVLENRDTFAPDNSEIQKFGIITRGIQAGNRTNASLTSSMDIQIWGKLYDDILIDAVISDQNIPIQPQGNTQQLQEFDRVYITLKKEPFYLQAGDVDLQYRQHDFNSYTKKARGLSVSTQYVTDQGLFFRHDTATQKYAASAGISRGRYARQFIQGVDGNQGPYKLRGAQNEMFIVILAGTEKVYLNGQLLMRGEQNDYVIDYNFGEIYFTSRCPISSQSRITVEFQYVEQYYLRPLVNATYQYTEKKFSLSFHAFSEWDAKNQPLTQPLSEQDISMLEASNSADGFVFVPGWDTIQFTNNVILYEMVDTLGYDSIFVYSTNPQKTLYRVIFTYVGHQRGDYVIDKNIANGRVYKWVPRLNGVPQGEYVPYRIIVAPKKQTVYSTSSTFHISRNTDLTMDISFSHNDMNTFSSQGKISGYASKISLHNRFFVSGRDTAKHNFLHQKIFYEYVQANYIPVEQFRPVEFARDWNLSNTQNDDMHIAGHQLYITKQHKQISSLRTEFLYSRNNNRALRNELSLNASLKKLHLQSTLSYLISEKDTLITSFFRHKSRLFYLIKTHHQIGIENEQEINLWKSSNNQPAEQSYEFFDISPFILLQFSNKLNMKTWYRYRPQYHIHDYRMRKFFEWYEYGTNIRHQMKNQMIQIDLVQRNTLFYRPSENKEQTILAQFRQWFRTEKQGFETNMFYEISSGNEIKKEISYIEVMPGQGQYIWNDYNNNGIKELDEFELAQFQYQGEYIRIILPGTEYIRVFPVRYSYSIYFRPSRQFPNVQNWLLKQLTRFSVENTVQTTTKSTIFKTFDFTLPFRKNIHEDSVHILYNSNTTATIFYNQGHPVFNMRYRFLQSQQKLFLISGSDYLYKRNHEYSFLWNFTRQLGIEPIYEQELSEIISELSLLKNYSLQWSRYTLQFHYQPSSTNRVSVLLIYKTTHTERTIPILSAQQFATGIEMRITPWRQITCTSRQMFHLLYYDGPLNHPAFYHAIEALEPGKNFTWNIVFNYQMNEIFMLTCSVESRFSEGKKPVHFGLLQFRALLR